MDEKKDTEIIEHLSNFEYAVFGDSPTEGDRKDIEAIVEIINEGEGQVTIINEFCGVIYWPGCGHLYPFHLR